MIGGPAGPGLLLPLLLTACAPRVFVEAPGTLAFEADCLRSAFTAPDSRRGGAFRGASSRDNADLVLRVEAAWSGDPRPEGRGETYLLSRVPVAPAIGIGDGGSSLTLLAGLVHDGVSLEDCRSGGLELFPLDEIRPPRVARPVSGLTVDEPGYPLVREVRARLEARSPRGRRASNAARGILADLEQSNLPGAAPDILWVVAAGDLMTGRGIDRRLREGGPGAAFGPDVLEALRRADLAVANLEGSLTERGRPAGKAYTFRSLPSVAEELAAAGLDVLLLANNHSLDWGPEGLSDTRGALAGAGIAAVGAGGNAEEALRPHRTEIRGRAVAVYGAAAFPRERSGWDGADVAARPDRAGIFWLDGEGLRRFRDATRSDTLDIVLLHGGEEWSRSPSREIRIAAENLADAGADLILGSHPHVVQGMEWIRGKPVFWSLGNFVFPGMEGTPGGEEGLLVRLGFLDGRLLYVIPMPLALSAEGVRTATR